MIQAYIPDAVWYDYETVSKWDSSQTPDFGNKTQRNPNFGSLADDLWWVPFVAADGKALRCYKK